MILRDAWLIVRGARPADADFLFRLRTDPATVAASPGAPPSYSTHIVWLAGVLSDPARRLYIAEIVGVGAVATVRLDRRGPRGAEVSVTVAPEYRRAGVGQRSLALVEAAARAWDIETLSATIKPENAPSVALFTRAGYTQRSAGGEWEKAL